MNYLYQIIKMIKKIYYLNMLMKKIKKLIKKLKKLNEKFNKQIFKYKIKMNEQI